MRPYTGFDFNATNKRAGLEALVDLLEEHFGVWNNGTYGIRNKRGKKSSSVHGTGRAADLSWRGAPYKGAGNYLEAVRLMDFLVEHADALHIEAIFDYYPRPYGRGWRCDRGTWTNYSSRAFSGSPGGDWIHLEIAPSHCDDAAYYRRTFAGLLAPPDTFTPEPINLTGDFDMKLVNPPARLYDSRTGGGPFAAGETRKVRIMDTSAVFVNITVVAKEDGYLTAWADGAPQPNVSNVNFKAGDVVCNTNWVPVQNSHISVFCSGAADVIIDAQASA